MDNVGLTRGYLELMDYREDYAKIYEDEKKRYEELKIELYEKYKNERKQYTLGKDKYIKEIINKAINEKNRR